MAEIKSTLDLVMERTRHLTLSAEEKLRQQRADFEKRLQGLLLHYENDALDVDTLETRIAALQAELQITDRRGWLPSMLKRLDPDNTNERWLDLLTHFMPAVGAPLEDILKTHQEQRIALGRTCKQRLREQLAARHGIRGSAVIPNLERDPRYEESLALLRRDTLSKIDAAMQQAL